MTPRFLTYEECRHLKGIVHARNQRTGAIETYRVTSARRFRRSDRVVLFIRYFGPLPYNTPWVAVLTATDQQTFFVESPKPEGAA